MDEPKRDLDERVKGLPREIAPPRDLWPDIDARIVAREKRARRPNVLVATAFVVAIASAAAVALVSRRGEDHDAGASPSAVMSVSAPLASPAPSAVTAVLPDEAAYDEAAATLRAELEARRAEEPPSVLRVVDENVRILDEAIGAVRAALVVQPNDAELRADLDRALEDKLDVLRAATELPSSPDGVER